MPKVTALLLFSELSRLNWDCTRVDAVRVHGACYWCCKLAEHLTTDPDAFTYTGEPDDEQLAYLGVIDPDVSGQMWITVSDPLTQMLARLPVQPWERTTPSAHSWATT